MKNIYEDLTALDLEHMLKLIVDVDRFQSKMGDDRDIIVVAFRVNDRDACTDLENFFERGYKYVLDADSSPSDDTTNSICFVEFQREKYFTRKFNEILHGLKLLTGIDNFVFKYYKSMKSLTKEELYSKLPTTPDEYDQFVEAEHNIKNQLNAMKTIAKLPITSTTESINSRKNRI